MIILFCVLKWKFLQGEMKEVYVFKTILEVLYDKA